MDPSIDPGLLYGASRERVVALVRHLDAAAAAVPVPACPGWSVHDVVAHLAGTVADAAAGKLEGAGTDAWTAAQVDARRGAALADVVDEWQAGAPRFEDGIRLIGPPMAAVAIADVWNHEQDLRGALGVDGGADPAAELTAIEGGLARDVVGGRIAAAGYAWEGAAEPYLAILAEIAPSSPLPR